MPGKFRERRAEIKKLPIRERPAFQKFKAVFPHIAGIVGNMVPGGGAIKGLVDALLAEPRSPVENEAITEFLVPIENEERVQDLEDLQNAREMEIERMDADDWFTRNIAG